MITSIQVQLSVQTVTSASLKDLKNSDAGAYTFLYGSGSQDPYLLLKDTYSDQDPAPAPAIFVITFEMVTSIFLAYYFSMLHLHNFSKIKSNQEVTKQ